MAEIYRAKEAFAFTGKDGVPQVIRPGDLMSDGDANFKGKEQLFEKVEVAAQRAVDRPKGKTEEATAKPKVEEATAEPNAKRSVSTVHASKATSSKAKGE